MSDDYHTRKYKLIANSYPDDEFTPCLECGIEVVKVEFSGTQDKDSGGTDWLDREGNAYCPPHEDAEEWELMTGPYPHVGE